jgi:coenzyme F420-reducing hydrogenase gamma subunit
MMGCESCHIGVMGQQMALNDIVLQAKKYAVENEKTMAIYKEGYDYRFIEYSIAAENGYQIVQVVSKHN